MTVLSQYVAVQARSVRAVNLEADLPRAETLQGFSAGSHVIDATRQIAAGLQAGPRPRAWSLTGPYGAGKSTYAVFLSALLGDIGGPSHAAAQRALRRVDPQLAQLVGLERRRLKLDRRGVLPAVAVARREPTALALSRALLAGAQAATASRRGRKPGFLHDLLEAVDARQSDSELVLRSVDALTSLVPTLIIVDELGKTLEFAADGSGKDDLYLLQRLAEQLSSTDRFRGGILTLQHLAFEDYLVGAGEARRREWRKVHGRFEDIAFVPSRGHGVVLVADALRWTGDTGTAKRIEQASRLAEAELHAAAGHIAPPSAYTGDPAATYPLHPLAALTLPTLAAQLGQHDRSLVSFLAGDSATSLRSRLGAMPLDSDGMPFVRLPELYDFFFSDGIADVVSGAEGARLREIRGRVEGADQLDGLELDILKATAVLNITAGRDAPPATEQMLIDAIVGPTGSATASEEAATLAITALQERGLLTFRRFAGEYRIWQGSDFDISAAAAAARERLSVSGADEIARRTIAEAHPLRPIVAQRYSQEHHVLRYFECRFAAEDEPLDLVEASVHGADGIIVYVLARRSAPSQVPPAYADGRPLVVVWAPVGRHLDELALDLAAAREVLDEAPELERDAVARQELRFRVSALRDRLVDALLASFGYGNPTTIYFARARRRTLTSASGFSALLSELCDERFPKTPIIRNEMINRRELTSQGAKARRELLERIIERADEDCLGIEGFGPERAMYEALLRHTGLHDNRDGWWGFGPPRAGSAVAEVWSMIMRFFDDATARRRSVAELYEQLQAPPFGLKDGPIPVLLSVALEYRSEDVFLYQDGTFQPSIDASMIERLLKWPERFSVKRAALLGIRGAVFEQLRDLVVAPSRASATTRNATTLAVVRPLIAFARSLPSYVRSTDTASSRSRAVCRALLEATEPDELLFAELPRACELSPILEAADDPAHSHDFVRRLRAALAELGGAYERLLDRITELMRLAFAVADEAADGLREDLRARSARLVNRVIDPKLRSFLLAAGDRQLEESEWAEAMAMNLTSKPPSSWTDHDVLAFEALLAERAAWFRRLEELYFAMLHRADESFDARKLTITAPDGTEISQIVPIDKVAERVAGAALASILEGLVEQLGGQRADTALTAALVRHVLTEEPATTSVMTTEAKPTRKRGAA
jgi:hypothetical protein